MTKHIEMSGMTASGMRVAGVLVALFGSLALTACGGGGGGGSVHDGSTDNTANVSFRNVSGGYTNNMYVHWDGINITGDIPDGATSAVTTVNATSHFMVFRKSGGVQLACTGTYVTPAQCTSTVYTCAG